MSGYRSGIGTEMETCVRPSYPQSDERLLEGSGVWLYAEALVAVDFHRLGGARRADKSEGELLVVSRRRSECGDAEQGVVDRGPTPHRVRGTPNAAMRACFEPFPRR
jgi:hypothetical protein